jgi:dipeptidyl aminopeptidase/acylaminoacyl peptidase
MPTPRNGHRLAAFACVLAAVLAQSPLSAQTPGRTLKLEDYLELESVSDPQIAPDASRIVYTRQWVDKINDRRESSLWIMNADGSKTHQLTNGGGARWSPDGTRIAYVQEGQPSGAQIFVRWMDAEGASTQITRLERSPSELLWSPDGKWIAFTSSVEDRTDFGSVSLPGRPSGAKWTGDPKVVERASYRRDRTGYIDTGWTHVFIVPAEGGTPRQITDGKWNHNDIAWSADGKEIFFVSNRRPDFDRPDNWQETDIYAVDVATQKIRQLTTRKGPDANPTPSPDGKLIAYTGDDAHRDTYRNQKIYLMNADGSNPRMISGNYDQQAQELRWAPDGSGLYFNVRMNGYANVQFISLAGAVKPVTDGKHIMQLTSFAKNGTAVGLLSSAYEPGDVYTFSLAKPAQRTRLTSVNADILQGVKLGDVEEVWYNSDGGFKIQGWIVKPPNFDPSKKYPLMLSIHGGPHSMYDGGFNFAFQEHAAHGYVTLYTNPRGSTGYGSPFANAINHDYPGADFPDLMKGVDEMLKKGYIDEQNLFVYGCSGGGILTTYIVGNTNRFKAASANCAIVNWMSAMGTSDATSYTRTFEKYFWEDPTEWIDRSSIFYVENVKTPTMLMTGEMDLRTPMGQAEEYYQALRILGVPTVLVRFQGEWHGTSSKPSNFLRTQLYIRKWFEKWGTHDDRRPVSDSDARSR